jgi:energy-converting hydrogenase A subunit M
MAAEITVEHSRFINHDAVAMTEVHAALETADRHAMRLKQDEAWGLPVSDDAKKEAAKAQAEARKAIEAYYAAKAADEAATAKK